MKTRNIFSLATSLLLCVTSIIPVASSASELMIDVNGGTGRYEVALQYSETEIIYRGIDQSSESNYRYITPYYLSGESKPVGYEIVRSFRIDPISEEEGKLLNEYLDFSHPEAIYDFAARDIVFINDDYSLDNMITLMKDVYNEFGFRMYYEPLEIAIGTYLQPYLQPLGDLDSDGTVNALDASNILTYYSDSQTGNTDTYTDEDIADITLLGDYDADGAVNALDASLVLKEYAETQTE